MKQNETTNPLNVCLLSANAEVAHASDAANFIEQTRFRVGGLLPIDSWGRMHPSTIRSDASKKFCKKDQGMVVFEFS